MRKKGWVLAAAACFLLAGCGESKEALDARLAGIGELENGDASAAIASFETALAEADGVVGEFELDVLKYRAQAEYETGDYAAAAHTFGILAEVDQNRPEYLYHKAASEALAGELETALADYALARESGSGAGVSGEQAAGSELALSAICAAAREAGEPQTAADFCRQALEEGSAGAEIYNQLGISLAAAGAYEEALSALEEGIALADADEARQLTQNMAAICEQQGDFARALSLLRACAADGGMTPELEKEIAFLESR